VQLTVTDSLGHTNTVTHSVTVSGGSSGLAAAFTVSTTSLTLWQPVFFNAFGSTDTGATITSYAWSFGDGSSGSGPFVVHQYFLVGTYSVTLTVTDSLGRSASQTALITVRAF
jgi:PKD repeat protein